MGNETSSGRHGNESGADDKDGSAQGVGAPRRKRDFLKNLVDDPMKSLGLVYYPDDSDDEDIDIDKVLEGLYVGGMEGAFEATALKRRGVTHILNLSSYEDNPKAHHHGLFEYMILRVPDLPTENLEQHFQKTNAFITEGRERGGVYVHCMWGMSRAPSTVMAYLIAEHKMDYREAYSAVKSARPQANPNSGFQRQLEGYAQSMVNRSTFTPSFTNNAIPTKSSPPVPRVLQTRSPHLGPSSPGSGDEGALSYWSQESPEYPGAEKVVI